MKEDLPDSDEIISATEVQAALDRLAGEITARFANRNPLVITVLCWNAAMCTCAVTAPARRAAIRARLLELGAAEVLTAAFALKERATPALIAADFTGVRAPDPGRWRNLPSIRAL